MPPEVLIDAILRTEEGSLSDHVFISHSTRDDDVVFRIRTALEGLGVPTWVDSRRLTAGEALEPAIRQAIEEARHFVVVLSAHAMNSPWVAQEIRYASEVRRRRGDGFKVIPLLLDPVEPAALPLWFDDEPVALEISVGAGDVGDAMPALLAALGLQLPADRAPAAQPAPAPVADLTLELEDPTIEAAAGKRRAAAVATLVYKPADGTDEVTSRRFRFEAPLGPIETGELAWYLERYAHWPSGVFKERAEGVEARLAEWGQALYAALTGETARPALEAWRAVPRDVRRRFSVLVDADPVAGAGDGKAREARESATQLLSLPWELTHDGRGFLFQGRRGVRVRRRLPNRGKKQPLVTAAPIRVLLASPRPEDEKAAFIDHRESARPLVDALATLGEHAELTLLAPPTFKALDAELERAAAAGAPYHVLHFDGHGVFDRRSRLGALCFEHPADSGKLEKRRTHVVDAEELARWLVATRRCRWAAFVSLELDGDARRVLWALGDQLVAGFASEAGRDEERGSVRPWPRPWPPTRSRAPRRSSRSSPRTRTFPPICGL